ncbi:MAG: cell division protein FtsZ, partial [Rhodobacteraceae bacterium]|nr:cell division protein FtsZ [Paracoccaceae bacterium]
INLDFADVRAVMDEMGKAMMGTGEATGEDRAIQAAEKAIANPLLDEISLHGARGVLINITGGYDLTLFELDEAANRIREKVDPEANIIVGSTLDPEMEGTIRVSVVATGIDASQAAQEIEVPRRRLSDPIRPELPERAAEAAAPAPMPEPEPEPEPEMDEPVFIPRNDEPPRHEAQPNLFAEQAAPSPHAAAARPRPQQAIPPLRYRQDQSEQEARQAEAPYRPAAAFDLDEVLHDPAQDPRAGSAQGGAESFVAPRRTPAGTPSKETLERLQAAVRKQPKAAAPPARPAAGTGSEADRGGSGSRFGIGSLISRMAGGQGGDGAARPARAHPPVSAHDEDPGISPEQERIEIPAFLRRQAN